MNIKSNINKVVLLLTATLVISGCNSGKNKPAYDDPDIQLVELSDDEKSK
jgi:predicted component of type VI protein secretion system